MAKTNITRLKKASKGAPPALDIAPDVIKSDSRPALADGKTVPLQLKIPESKFAEFGELAAKVYGHKKGAKSLFFLEMMEHYKASRE